MKVILCPVDFSENSLKALEFASALSFQLQAKLFILNKFNLTEGEQIEVTDDLFNKTKKESQEKLETLKDTIVSDYPGLKVEVQASYGIEPAQVILRLARKIKAELIIMGTKGAGGFKEIFFGTTTTSVTSKASVPVLAFPVAAKPSLPRSIIYATDLKWEDSKVLYPLGKLAVRLGAVLIFLYVAKGEDKAKGVETIRRELESSEGFSEISKAQEVHFAEVISTDVFGAIQDYANETGAGLIALGNHQKGYLEKLRKGDLTRLMTMYAEIPILILHKKK
jgi:nucleotide-binding universal stress UspA family protein